MLRPTTPALAVGGREGQEEGVSAVLKSAAVSRTVIMPSDVGEN